MNPIATYRLIIRAAGRQAPVLRRCLAFAVLAAAMQGAGFALFVPLFLALAVGQPGTAVAWLGAASALLVLSSLCRWFAQDYDYRGACARAGDAMRRHLGEQLRRIPLQTLYRRRSGELNALLAGTVDEVFNYTLNVSMMLINAVVPPLATAAVVLFWDWRSSLVLLLSYPLILPLYHWAEPLLARGHRQLADAHAALNAELLEYSRGLPALKAANSTGAHLPRLSAAIGRVAAVQRGALAHEARPNALLGSAVEICLLLVLLTGLYWVSGGRQSAWLLSALIVASARFAEPLGYFLSLMGVYAMLRDGYGRLQEMLATPALARDGEAALPARFDIRLENVHFHYEANPEPVLRGLDLTIPERGMTALVGTSGCGKTTVSRLIMRYADPQQGRIRIGGTDIRALAPEDLMRLISVVFQDVYLFDDTIENNIRLGKADATAAEIEAAARAARCHDFISALPEGYQTRVGDIGGKLSGGEKQRISIARALLKNAPIIILDEPTAALDTESEVAVQQAIDELVRDKTVLVITHRLSTISGAEQIVVLDKGIISERGTHETLLTQNGRYAKLWAAGGWGAGGNG